MCNLMRNCLQDEFLGLQVGNTEIVANHQVTIRLMPYLPGTFSLQVTKYGYVRHAASAAQEQWPGLLQPLLSCLLESLAKRV